MGDNIDRDNAVAGDWQSADVPRPFKNEPKTIPTYEPQEVMFVDMEHADNLTRLCIETAKMSARFVANIEEQFPGCTIEQVGDETIVTLPKGAIVVDESAPIKHLPNQRNKALFDRMRKSFGSLLHIASFGPSASGIDPFALLDKPRKPRFSTQTKYSPCNCGSGLDFKFCCFKKYR